MAEEKNRRRMDRRAIRQPNRWNDPKKAISPSELQSAAIAEASLHPEETQKAALPYREAAALAALMYMQRDAVAFFRVASGRMNSAAADNVLKTLEILHNNAVSELWAHLQNIPRPEYNEEADTDTREYFSPLAQNLPYGLTRQLADDIARAEESCIHTTEEVLNNGISEATKEFLMEHLIKLEEVHDRAEELVEIARSMEIGSS